MLPSVHSELFVCEPCQAKICLGSYAHSKGQDQPAHACSLTRAFTVLLQNHWIKQKLQRITKALLSLYRCTARSEPLLSAYAQSHLWKTQTYWTSSDLSRSVRKLTFRHVSPVKIQVSLHNQTCWLESSLGTFLIAKDVKFLHVDNKDCLDGQTDLNLCSDAYARRYIFSHSAQGPVVQSVISLTSSLRVISLIVLADSIHNILIFFAEKMWVAFAATHIFSAKNFSIFAYHLM